MHTSPRTSTSEPKIVVRGGALVSVWPTEASEPVMPSRTAEIGDPDAVFELLAAVDGVSADDYRLAYWTDSYSVRTLTAHCRAAILQAALRIQGELSPAAVVDVLHRDLLRASAAREELVDRLAS